MKNITELQEILIDKWYFGDIELSDYQAFSELFVQEYPDLAEASVLLSMSYDNTSWLEDVNTVFAKCMREVGKTLLPIDRLKYIRGRSQKEFEEVVFSISEEELDYISGLDYGQYVEDFRRDLKKVIFEFEGLFVVNKPSYEVVQLGRHFAYEGHEREFAICNCLVAQNVLWDVDHSNEVAWMLEKIEEYNKLPDYLFTKVMRCLETADRFQKITSLKPHLFSKYNLRYS